MSELTDLQDRLALYVAAEKKILEGNQSYQGADGINWTRANLGQIQLAIRNLRAEIALLNNNGSFGSQQVVFGGRR